MLSKRYEPTEVDRRTWLHVSSGTLWSTSSDTHQVVEIRNDRQEYAENSKDCKAKPVFSMYHALVVKNLKTF